MIRITVDWVDHDDTYFAVLDEYGATILFEDWDQAVEELRRIVNVALETGQKKKSHPDVSGLGIRRNSSYGNRKPTPRGKIS